MTSLVVTAAFVPYPIGTVINDTATISAILGGENAVDVVRILGGTQPFISAPSVSGLIAGGLSLISGQYWNGTPSGIIYSIDGAAGVTAPNPTIGSGLYSFSIVTPRAGSRTIQVVGTGGNTAASSVTSFVTAIGALAGAAVVSGYIDGSGHTIVVLSDGSTVDLGVLVGAAGRIEDDSGSLLADAFGGHLLAA